jgi:hypothetical protein
MKADTYDTIDYKYGEDKTLEEIQAYIDSTYGQHYSQSKFQATEFIIDNGHGTGFCLGNIMKYAQRYGKKDGSNKKDLLKIIHYAIIMLHVHNKEQESQVNPAPVPVPAPETNTITTLSVYDSQLNYPTSRI